MTNRQIGSLQVALGALLWSFGGVFCKWGTKQGAVAASLGGAAIYVFCYYCVKVLGINAVVWGLLASGIHRHACHAH